MMYRKFVRPTPDRSESGLKKFLSQVFPPASAQLSRRSYFAIFLPENHGSLSWKICLCHVTGFSLQDYFFVQTEVAAKPRVFIGCSILDMLEKLKQKVLYKDLPDLRHQQQPIGLSIGRHGRSTPSPCVGEHLHYAAQGPRLCAGEN